MNLDRAIEILAEGRPSHIPLEREFAVAAFAAWLNSPDEKMICEWISLVTFNCVMASDQKADFDLNAPWYLEVCEPSQYVKNIDDCVPAYSFVNDEYPNVYDNRRYVSDVVRFLLTYNQNIEDKRKAASLRKAYDFINMRGGFVEGRYPHSLDYFLGSLSGHQVVWKRFKTSAPFLFVNHHWHGINWRLNPRSRTYVKSLTSIARRVRDVQDFFSKVAWVQQRLKLVLDRRSMQVGEYHRFASTVPLKEFQLPALPEGTIEAMESYSQADSA